MEIFSALLVLCAGNSPVNGEFRSQRPETRALMFSLICAWINGWANNREAGDFRRHRAFYGVTVMQYPYGMSAAESLEIKLTALYWHRALDKGQAKQHRFSLHIFFLNLPSHIDTSIVPTRVPSTYKTSDMLWCTKLDAFPDSGDPRIDVD